MDQFDTPFTLLFGGLARERFAVPSVSIARGTFSRLSYASSMGRSAASRGLVFFALVAEREALCKEAMAGPGARGGRLPPLTPGS